MQPHRASYRKQSAAAQVEMHSLKSGLLNARNEQPARKIDRLYVYPEALVHCLLKAHAPLLRSHGGYSRHGYTQGPGAVQ